MSDRPFSASPLPEAEIRRKKSFSLVWLIPIVAVVVGAIIAVQAILTKGPLITITFKNSAGLVAGKTEVRYKDVTVGLVEEIHLAEDLASVIVEARMNNSIKPFLLDTTRFWVETARISGGEVSGLGTLLSGAYIGLDPGTGTKPERAFVGRDTPPVVTTGLAGREFVLKAETLGSVNVRTPIFYRQIKVGEVVGYQLDEDGSGVTAKIFINKPYDRFVKTSSRFWVSSGIDLKLDSSGVSLNTESLASILYGGISFETPVGFEKEAEAKEEDTFSLFRNYDDSKAEHYFKRNYYFAHFQDSVRGLSPGASVEFLGFKIGEVVDMKLEFDIEKIEFKAPVLFYVEPERIHALGVQTVAGKEMIDELVRNGMRVKLKSGNLLTGQLYIDLEMMKNPKKQEVDYSLAHPLVPTVPSDAEELTSSIRSILDDMKKINFGRLGADLHESLSLLNVNLEKTDKLFGTMNTDTMPEVKVALVGLQATLDDLRGSIGHNSDFNQDARSALAELAEASRSIKVLTDYLSQHPESLVRGKDKSE